MAYQGARLNLVRVDDLETSEGLDAESGQDVYTQADEIELVNPNGEPAAMMGAPSFVNNDIGYQYINGGVGISPRRRRHQIQLTVDYLGDEARQRLEQWAHDRALVWFNPGFGRYTDLAFRAIPGSAALFADGSTALTDLTGRYSVTTNGDNATNYVWDAWRRVMLGDYTGTAPRRLIATPGGAGQICERSRQNRHSPAYPASATEGHGSGDAGWEKYGTNSADLTFAHVTDAFGHDDMPDALRVTTTNAASRNRQLVASNQWNAIDPEYMPWSGGQASFSGSGRANVSIWFKGRFNDGATVEFGQGGGNSDSVDLSVLDLSEWTKVCLSVYSADWGSGGSPYLLIDLDTSTDADNADFMIGPCVVEQISGSATQQEPEYGVFDTTVSASYNEVTSYTLPTSGAMFASFWVPASGNLDTHYLIGSSGTFGNLGLSGGSTIRFYRTASDYLESASISSSINYGAINTVAATWGSGGDMRLYFNGALVDTAAADERDNDLSSTSGTLYLGQGAGYGCHPLIPLTWRIDRRVYTTAEMAQIHQSLADPVAAWVSVQARGRKYRIVQIPSTPRNQQGGTQWTGTLALEEHEYDSNLRDITTEETY